MQNYILTLLSRTNAMEIASRVLPKDWEECEAWCDCGPAKALLDASRSRLPTFALYSRAGEPLAGAGAYLTGVDNQVGVWLMATDAITIQDAIFMRKNMENGLALLCESAGKPDAHAICMASDENTVHLRWLEATGWVRTGKTEIKNQTLFRELMYVRS